MSQLVRKISLISPLSFFLSPLLSFIAACSNIRSWLNGLTFDLFYGFFGCFPLRRFQIRHHMEML